MWLDSGLVAGGGPARDMLGGMHVAGAGTRVEVAGCADGGAGQRVVVGGQRPTVRTGLLVGLEIGGADGHRDGVVRVRHSSDRMTPAV